MKICTKCGAQNDDGAAFCVGCGARLDEAERQNPPEAQNPRPAPTAQPSPQYGQAPVPVDDGHGLSIAALVCGILGIVGGWIPVVTYFTLVLSVVGLVLGVMGRKKSIAAHGKASGMATAGLVLGIIGVGFAALGLICTVACTSVLCSAVNSL